MLFIILLHLDSVDKHAHSEWIPQSREQPVLDSMSLYYRNCGSRPTFLPTLSRGGVLARMWAICAGAPDLYSLHTGIHTRHGNGDTPECAYGVSPTQTSQFFDLPTGVLLIVGALFTPI